MKKIFLSLLFLLIALPAQAWFWDKTDKTLEMELQGKGYAGTLPDLNKQNFRRTQKVAKPVYEAKEKFTDSKDLKPVPRDNPAFINIISKKDKTSEYLLDINELIPIIEKVVDCVEEDGSVQLFVTRANVLNMNLDHFFSKYKGQPESYYESYRKLMEVNGYVKTLAQLRKEAVTYQRYLAYQTTGSVYNPENINQQLQYLLDELSGVIVLLKQEE